MWEDLPEHINNPEEWLNKDDSKHWYTDWRRHVKGFFAYSWKRRHWFGKLRRYPITLIAFFGRGESRWENEIMAIRSVNTAILFYWPSNFYVSRVQYWCDWSFVVNWPLGVFFHFKWGKKGVVQGYLGWKRDSDVWWFPAVYLGRGWK